MPEVRVDWSGLSSRVELELAANGYFRCVCGKWHGKLSGAVCPKCGEPFPYEWRYQIERVAS